VQEFFSPFDMCTHAWLTQPTGFGGLFSLLFKVLVPYLSGDTS